jgi:hypothetical protein
MSPTNHRPRTQTPGTSVPRAPRTVPPAPGASAKRARARTVTLTGCLLLAVAVAGCPAPATSEPVPKAPALGAAEPEPLPCAADGGRLSDDCLPDGCREALSPDAAAETVAEPNCDDLLAD